MPPDRLEFLIPFYLPALWALIIVCAAMGVVGLLAPNTLRAGLIRLNHKATLRLLGAATALLGFLVFVRADRPYAPLLQAPVLIFWLGFLVFLKGAIWAVFPGLIQWGLGFYTARSNLLLRAISLLCLGFASVFFLAGKVTAILAF